MPLAPGLYEHPLTAALAEALSDAAAELRPDQVPGEVARLVAAEVRRALLALGGEVRVASSPVLAERVLREIGGSAFMLELKKHCLDKDDNAIVFGRSDVHYYKMCDKQYVCEQ